MFLVFYQRRRRPTSSATRSWTSKGRRKATVGRTRTPGSSVTNSERILPDLLPLILLCVNTASVSLRSSGTFTAGTCCAPTSHPLPDLESSREDWPHSRWLVTARLWTAGTPPTALCCSEVPPPPLTAVSAQWRSRADRWRHRSGLRGGRDSLRDGPRLFQPQMPPHPPVQLQHLPRDHGQDHLLWTRGQCIHVCAEGWLGRFRNKDFECLSSHCRCAATSWSVCVTWAGQERAVTPRPPAATWWWDPLPRFQVETRTLHPSTRPPSFIHPSLLLVQFNSRHYQHDLSLRVVHRAQWFLVFRCVLALRPAACCFIFFFHYFHTHSLLTGWCLWRSDMRSDLSSFSLCLFVSRLLFFARPKLQLISVSFFWILLLFPWMRAHRSPSESRCHGNSATIPTFFLPSSPWTLLLLIDVSRSSLFVVCEFPRVCAIDMTSDGHLMNTLLALLSSSVSGITVTNIIIGAIVGSILFLVLILAATAWCYKWVSAPAPWKLTVVQIFNVFGKVLQSRTFGLLLLMNWLNYLHRSYKQRRYVESEVHRRFCRFARFHSFSLIWL